MHLIWPLGGTRYLDLAEPAALKQVFNDRHGFVKDVEAVSYCHSYFMPTLILPCPLVCPHHAVRQER